MTFMVALGRESDSVPLGKEMGESCLFQNYSFPENAVTLSTSRLKTTEADVWALALLNMNVAGFQDWALKNTHLQVSLTLLVRGSLKGHSGLHSLQFRCCPGPKTFFSGSAMQVDPSEYPENPQIISKNETNHIFLLLIAEWFFCILQSFHFLEKKNRFCINNTFLYNQNLIKKKERQSLFFRRFRTWIPLLSKQVYDQPDEWIIYCDWLPLKK